MDAHTRKLLHSAWRENRLAAVHIDAQNGFLDKHTMDAFDGICRSAQHMRTIGVPNIWVAFAGINHSQFGKVTTVAEFDRSETYPSDKIALCVNARKDESVVLKAATDGFSGSNDALDNHLRGMGVDTIIVDGVYSFACVFQTIKAGLLKDHYNIIANLDGMDWHVPAAERAKSYTSNMYYNLYPNTDAMAERFAVTTLNEMQSALRTRRSLITDALPAFLQRFAPGLSTP